LADPAIPIIDLSNVLAVPVPKAAKAAGVSRSTLYEAMRCGELRYIKIGARRVVLIDDLREWLLALREDPRSAPIATPRRRTPSGYSRRGATA
jgi:excisionase family DNA binding protein